MNKGEFDKAREAYEQALALEPGNVMIERNYDLFSEINDRAKSSARLVKPHRKSRVLMDSLTEHLCHSSRRGPDF